MKAVKTVVALSNEAFQRRLNDSILDLESAGMPVLGIQTNQGLWIKQGTILFEDNLSEEQRQLRYEMTHSKLAAWFNLVVDLLLLGAASWLLLKLWVNPQIQVAVLIIFGLLAAGVTLIELLNAALEFSMRGLGAFALAVVVADKLLAGYVLSTATAAWPLIIAVTSVSAVAIGGKPIFGKIQLWLQHVAVDRRG
ncbi:hypothetical protein [Lacticaseibacillus suibinensis]|uniref:hypothetical protein n=1 Tax=Lacticaseibacillus suibinensis TaxID=2486011 RepID=UPI001940F4BD|nr:hypothetical protein [Lacticaseibacillus suibinensis]